MVVRVLANIEFEPEELINEVAREYECTVKELSMDDLIEYVDNHVYHMKGMDTNCIKCLSGWGKAIDGFYEYDYYQVKNVLDRIQEDTEE